MVMMSQLPAIIYMQNFFLRISPNVFFFFTCVIPSIWILEVTLLNQRLLERENVLNNITTVATTTTTQIDDGVGILIYVILVYKFYVKQT